MSWATTVAEHSRGAVPIACVWMASLVVLSVADVTNWVAWVNLETPRTNAQAHVMSHFVFLVGGTTTPFSYNNVSSGAFVGVNQSGVPEAKSDVVSVAAAAAVGISPVILWIDWDNVFEWKALPFHDVTPTPISAKSGSVATDHSIFISYAADILQPENDMFVEVVLPTPIGMITSWGSHTGSVTAQPATLNVLSPSLTKRNAAALGRLKMIVPPATSPGEGQQSILEYLPQAVYTIFLFGGRSASGIPIPDVEQYNNGSWTVVGALTLNQAIWTCNCAVNQPGANSPFLVLSGCLHCVSGQAALQTIVFDTRTFVFLPTQLEPENFTNPNYLPSFNGAAMQTLMQFQPTVYEVYGYSSGPAINMYDTLLQQENQIITVDIQQRRTECAQFNSMGFVFCIGGTSFPDRMFALLFSDSAQVHPAPDVSFDHVSGDYKVGDDITVFAGLTCGAPTSTFRLTTDPHCDIPVPFVQDVPCGSSATFSTGSAINLLPGEELEMYLCFTEGSCSAVGNDRVPCGNGLKNDDCRWFPCCWDNVAQECYSFVQPSPTNTPSTFFTNAIASPLTISRPPLPPPPPTFWYQSTAFIIGVSVGGCVVLYFAAALVWKAHVQNEVQERQSLQSSLFTAFGKNYNVIGQIGQGSFGTVFLAERASDKKQVALKVLPCNDAKQRNVALAEYDVLHNLKHDNLIRVLDLILNWDTASGFEQNEEVRQKRRIAKRGSPSSRRRARQRSTSGLGEDSTSGLETSLNSPNGSMAPRSSTANESMSSGEELLRGPLVHPHERRDSDASSDARASNFRAYGSFAQAVNFASATDVERRDLEFVAACPRFICLVTDYYPDGDLRDFVLHYGLPKASSTNRSLGSFDVRPSASSPSKLATPQPSSLGAQSPLSGATVSRATPSPPTAAAKGAVGGSANHSSSSGSVGEAATPHIPERLVRSFAAQLCSLMVYMHCRKKPVIHRDLKPENVLMDGERLVVTDFGLAGVQDDDEYLSTRAGTLLFSPPEALRRQVSPAVDMWAVGCILYAVCTRRVLPETARIMFTDVDDEDFEESIRRDLNFYSKTLQDLVLGLLVKDPAGRLTAEQARALTDSAFTGAQ